MHGLGKIEEKNWYNNNNKSPENRIHRSQILIDVQKDKNNTRKNKGKGTERRGWLTLKQTKQV